MQTSGCEYRNTCVWFFSVAWLSTTTTNKARKQLWTRGDHSTFSSFLCSTEQRSTISLSFFKFWLECFISFVLFQPRVFPSMKETERSIHARANFARLSGRQCVRASDGVIRMEIEVLIGRKGGGVRLRNKATKNTLRATTELFGRVHLMACD